MYRPPINTVHATVYLTFFLACHVHGCCISSSPFVIMSNTGLDQLALASSFMEAMKEIRQEMKALRENVNRLKGGDPASQLSHSDAGSSQEGIALMPRSGLFKATKRIPGTTWAEEMDTLNKDRDVAWVVEVSPHTVECIRTSFQSLPNATRQTLRSKFILPKAPVTITPRLNKVYVDSCSKSTKQADKSLARIQALTLDAAGLLSEALEMVDAVDRDSNQVELDLDKLVAAQETLLAFIGNASCQTSNLRRQKIMEDINKDLISYTAEQEEHFTAQAPMLFGQHFMKMLQNTRTRSRPCARCARSLCRFFRRPNTDPAERKWLSPGRRLTTRKLALCQRHSTNDN